MNLALSKGSALKHVRFGDTLEIRDGIIFNFHSGLPHMPKNFNNERHAKETRIMYTCGLWLHLKNEYLIITVE